MKYPEHIPLEPISRAVDRLWLLEARPPAKPVPFERIPPDGCSEIIFQLEGRNEVRRGHRIELEPAAFVVAQQGQPLEVRIGPRLRNLGVRFSPGGLFSMLGIPLFEMVDQVIPLAAVWPRLERILVGQLDPNAPAAELFRRTESVLQDCLLPLKQGPCPVHVAVSSLGRASGRLSVSDLARVTGWSARQLERRFRIEVGFGPKMLGRIVRFQSLLKQLAPPQLQAPSWADLALASGYADQAHLIREFRALSGTTPGSFLRKTNPVLAAFLSGKFPAR